jgi:hypothetical protein
MDLEFGEFEWFVAEHYKKEYVKGMPIILVKKDKMILTFGKASLM